MNRFGFLFSFALHTGLFILALFWAQLVPQLDRELPVYKVNLVSLPAPGPAGPAHRPPAAAKPEPAPAPEPAPQPEPAPAPEPAPQPEPVAVPEPPAPEAKPEPAPKALPAKEISEQKAPEPKPEPKPAPKPEPKPEPAPKPAPKPEPKPAPKPKEPTAEEKRQQALAQIQNQVAAEEKSQKRALERELAAMAGGASDLYDTGATSGGGGSGLGAIYLDLVAKAVKKNWSYPAYGAQDELFASVELSIGMDGTIESYRLTRSSGRDAYDDSVLRAVAATAKVPPPTRDDLRIIIINFNPREP